MAPENTGSRYERERLSDLIATAREALIAASADPVGSTDARSEQWAGLVGRLSASLQLLTDAAEDALLESESTP